MSKTELQKMISQTEGLKEKVKDWHPEKLDKEESLKFKGVLDSLIVLFMEKIDHHFKK